MEGASERGSPDEGMDTEGRLTRERTRRPQGGGPEGGAERRRPCDGTSLASMTLFTTALLLLGQRAESDNLRKDNPYFTLFCVAREPLD